jgi:tetratricopeptide (TPR) repeat protein
MSFGDNFYNTSEQMEIRGLKNAMQSEFRASSDLNRQIRQVIVQKFDQGIERINQEQRAAAAVSANAAMETAREMQYMRDVYDQQANQIGESLGEIAGEIRASRQRISEDIQDVARVIGAAAQKISWNLEQLNETTQAILEALIQRLNLESREFFKQGKDWFEKNEFALAKDRFELALQSDNTNFLAYEYLGFVGVENDVPEFAMRNFELAAKAAPPGHHKAVAFSHYARCFFAKGDVAEAERHQKKAVAESDGEAWLWYELASYQAQLTRPEQMTEALRRAIELDWVRWAWVIQDRRFDALRADVSVLLAKMKREAKDRAAASFEWFKKAHQTATYLGMRPDSSVMESCALLLEEDNVYSYLDAKSCSDENREEFFRDMEKWLKEKRDLAFRHVQNLNQLKREALDDVDRVVNEDVRSTITNVHKNQEGLRALLKNRAGKVSTTGSALAVGIPIVACIVFYIVLITETRWNTGGAIFESILMLVFGFMVIFGIGFLVACALIGIASIVDYFNVKDTEGKLSASEEQLKLSVGLRENEIRSIGKRKREKVESSYAAKVMAAETIIKGIETASSTIKCRTYLSAPVTVDAAE